MGCSSLPCNFVRTDPAIQKILDELDEKYQEAKKNFIKDKEKLEIKQNNQRNERYTKLTEYKNKGEKISEEELKKLNKTEAGVEEDVLIQKASEMHCLFEIGLGFTEPMRTIAIDKLLEKAKSAPAAAVKRFNDEIEEIKKLPPVELLDSVYCKALMSALAKKGLSSSLLNDFKKNLLKDRGERRKKEREEFGIEKNEFDDDEDIDIDLFSLVKSEAKENFEDYAKSKLKELRKMKNDLKK